MKFISHTDLKAWLGELAASRRVIIPQKEGPSVLYKEFGADKEPEFNLKPTESAKGILFPRSEALFSFRKEKTGEGNRLSLQAAPEAVSTVLFGLTGCDAAGFGSFDPVFMGRELGRYTDPLYSAKRESTILIVRACAKALPSCFCTWVGGDPVNRSNADILATELASGWLLEPLTARAKSILDSKYPHEAEEALVADAERIQQAARESIRKAPDLDGLEAALDALFEDREFWQSESASCLGCGTCAYLCPACHCFNISDEKANLGGVRLRSWDNCMSALYTQEAGGHNPRADKAARLRNRILHKFSYFLKNNHGRISCSGCGRCIRSCPSGLDIRRIALAALNKRQDISHD